MNSFSTMNVMDMQKCCPEETVNIEWSHLKFLSTFSVKNMIMFMWVFCETRVYLLVNIWLSSISSCVINWRFEMRSNSLSFASRDPVANFHSRYLLEVYFLVGWVRTWWLGLHFVLILCEFVLLFINLFHKFKIFQWGRFAWLCDYGKSFIFICANLKSRNLGEYGLVNMKF